MVIGPPCLQVPEQVNGSPSATEAHNSRRRLRPRWLEGAPPSTDIGSSVVSVILNKRLPHQLPGPCCDKWGRFATLLLAAVPQAPLAARTRVVYAESTMAPRNTVQPSSWGGQRR